MYVPTSDDLSLAIDRDELFVVFQPIVDARTLRICAMESLIRWRHSVHGLIGPGHFVGLAETSGLSHAVTRRVVNEAAIAAAAFPEMTIAINVSANEILSSAFSERIVSEAEAAGFPLHRMEIEILESAFIRDFDAARASLESLRSRGIKVALDDFGTGYSSLSYLRRLPIDKIKIDKSFIDDVHQVQSAAIVHAVVALGRALGMKVCAEGVEDKLQHQFLKAAGCHYLQGYHFAQPAPLGELAMKFETIAGETRFREAAQTSAVLQKAG